MSDLEEGTTAKITAKVTRLTGAAVLLSIEMTNVVIKATTNVVLKTRTAKAVTIKMTVVAEITKGNNFRKNDYQLSIY